MIDQQILNKIIRKKVLWSEIKAKEQEYTRLQKQIDELEKAKKDVSFEVQERLVESQKIAEWILERESKALIDAGL